jgi:hypothetical protein
MELGSPAKLSNSGQRIKKQEARKEPFKFLKPPIMAMDRIQIDSLMVKLLGSLSDI